MARTSRNGAPAANVDALDNLNLDDMFADEGDALFDGLDIDLGNMDDLAGASSEAKSSAAAPIHPPAPSASSPPEADDGSSTKRRKTKRKIKTPMLYEDEDDEYEEPKKKKKRAASKVTSKKKSTTKSSIAVAAAAAATVDVTNVVAASAPPKAKGKARAASVSMPPPTARSGTVAAAGQFGGRQKRGTSVVLPKMSKNRALPMGDGSRPARATSVQLPTSMSQIYATHPGLQQGPFCGILPSNTLFYPFMPQLPSEPSFKHKKVVPAIDRIHTSFMSYLSAPPGKPPTGAGVIPATESDPIFELMAEAFKDEKPSADGSSNANDKNVTVGNAIGSLRRTISMFDRNNLAGDLLAVCALLKRQHDFLKQNAANMEKWCKGHLSEQDYASVYLPPKQKAKRKAGDLLGAKSVLSTFKVREIKVLITCYGFKEPKSGPPIATLPSSVVSDVNEAPSKAKKRKLAAGTTAKDATEASSPAAATPTTPATKHVVQYSEMRPVRRRKHVTDLISRTARDLESKYLQRLEDQKQLLDRQQNDLRKLVDEDKVIMPHTTGMWRWLEKSGHFGPIDDSNLQWRLEDNYSPDSQLAKSIRPSGVLKDPEEGRPKVDESNKTTVIQRLQSLLLVADDDENDDESETSNDDHLYDNDGEWWGDKVLDLSSLSGDERSFVHLCSIGLVESSQLSKQKAKRELITLARPSTKFLSDKKDGAKLPEDELGEIVQAMVSDLNQLNTLNMKRAGFIEEMARAEQQSEADSKREAILIAKCQQLMRKTKEMKAKHGKVKSSAKNDELALPW